MTLNKNNYTLATRNCSFHVADYFKDTGSRAPKGQIFNCSATERFRSDYPLLFSSISFRMRNRKEICVEGKYSTFQPASSLRNGQKSPVTHELLLKIIDDYFDCSGLGGPVRDMSMLLGCFLCTQNDEETGYSHSFLNNISSEVIRLNAFLAELYEERNFIKNHGQKEVCHG